MFDQYGTVVDMQGGLVKIATPFLKEKGWTGNQNSFVTWWRRTHFENSMIDVCAAVGDVTIKFSAYCLLFCCAGYSCAEMGVQRSSIVGMPMRSLASLRRPQLGASEQPVS